VFDLASSTSSFSKELGQVNMVKGQQRDLSRILEMPRHLPRETPYLLREMRDQVQVMGISQESYVFRRMTFLSKRISSTKFLSKHFVDKLL
jgi:hypothetical protein